MNGRNPNRVRAGGLDRQPAVPGSKRTFAVLEWLDEDTLVTWRATEAGLPRSDLARVAVASGRSEELVRLPEYGWGIFQFATDLLDAPSVHAEEPPSPLDPRITAGLAVGTALAAGVALLLWRRRVRP
jgi:hypothetical protein